MGVNFWGVVHGCRTFLPHLAGGGHIVNTASMAGLMPGFAPSYDASKHAVVAISEDLFSTLRVAGLPIGVSVLCPGWVRTNIIDADRNWPAELGEKPVEDPANAVVPQVRRAGDRRGQDTGIGRRRRARRDHRRPLLGHPPPGLPRHRHRAVAPHRRPARSRAARAAPGDAAVVPAHRRGHGGDGWRRPELTRRAPLTPRRSRGNIGGDRSTRPAVRTEDSDRSRRYGDI